MEQTESKPMPDEATTPYAGLNCYQKATSKREPLFCLRAQDFSAPAVVEFWADLNAPQLGKLHPKIVQAREIAKKMRAFPGRRQPD